MMASVPEYCIAEEPIPHEIPFVDDSGLQYDEDSPIGSFLRGDFIADLFEPLQSSGTNQLSSRNQGNEVLTDKEAEKAVSHILPERLTKTHKKMLQKEKKLGESLAFHLKLRHEATEHCRDLSLLFPKDAKLINSFIQKKNQSVS